LRKKEKGINPRRSRLAVIAGGQQGNGDGDGPFNRETTSRDRRNSQGWGCFPHGQGEIIEAELIATRLGGRRVLGFRMIKERFEELSNQLMALRKRSDASRDLRERRTLLEEMRQVLKEIDELVMNQTEWNHSPSPGGRS
jgi:hypothetical protein